MAGHLLFVTSNPGKVREVETILDAPIEQVALDLPEIQALDVEVVVRHKAHAAYSHVGKPILVEDTGLYLGSLGGLPGALVRWFLIAIGPEGIAALIPSDAPRQALARTAVAICDGESVEVFIGETRGEVVPHPRGAGGFGWDSLFRPDGALRTFAEMDQAEKNAYSMRRRALIGLRGRLAAG